MTQWLGLFLAMLILAGPNTIRGYARDSAILPEQATAGKSAPAGQTSAATVDRILPERANEMKAAAERILQVIREDKEFDQSDLRFMEAFRKAHAALDIKVVVESRYFAHGKRFQAIRLQDTAAACKRVIGAFNQDGGDAHFSSDDLDLLQAFRQALVAAEIIRSASSPALAKKVTKEEIQAGVEASKRILDAFNEKGGDASFSWEDKEIMKTFAKVLPSPK